MSHFFIFTLAMFITSSAFAVSRNSRETVQLESRFSKTRVVTVTGQCNRIFVKLERADGRIVNLPVIINEANSIVVRSTSNSGGAAPQMKVGEADSRDVNLLQRSCKSGNFVHIKPKLFSGFSVVHRQMVENRNSSVSGRCGFNLFVGIHCSRGYSLDFQTNVDDFVVSAGGNRLNVRVKSY